ncbi:hypothetical protein SASPL_152665 [Salvia splendens]|uniref:Mitochondrial import inner membrane translocase subunit TIM50 n=1 Tax=Salvia splendens TaxID=180675 RepID=A0A8X8W3R5_SALSN|nr:hypothetical protein SASPL_152665 [Salvia splendens]
MSALSRHCARLNFVISSSRTNRRFFSTAANDTPRDSIISASVLSEQTPQPPSGPPPAAESPKGSWGFLKYGLVAALIGGIATSGYATYAYTTDEVDEKTKSFHASAKYTVADDATSLDVRFLLPLCLAFAYNITVVRLSLVQMPGRQKFQAYLRAAAMSGPAKLVEVYLDLRRLAEEHIKGFTEPTSDKLLPDLHPLEQHIFTLVLDLNETLIYSDWKYVDPVVERLDTKHCIRYRLSRGETKYVNGKHYRDLSMLNRDPAKVIYISGHALESSLQPENSVQVKPWQGEQDDTALLDLIPFLEYVAKHRPADIRTVLASYQGRDIAKEFIERSKEHQRRMQEQKQQGRLWKR